MTSTSIQRGSAGGVDRSARRSLLAGALTGIGVAAFLDETVFHQLLL